MHSREYKKRKLLEGIETIEKMKIYSPVLIDYIYKNNFESFIKDFPIVSKGLYVSYKNKKPLLAWGCEFEIVKTPNNSYSIYSEFFGVWEKKSQTFGSYEATKEHLQNNFISQSITDKKRWLPVKKHFTAETFKVTIENMFSVKKPEQKEL